MARRRPEQDPGPAADRTTGTSPAPEARATGPYHFRLLALSIDRLLLRTDPSCRAVEVEARKTQVQLPAKKP